MLSSALVKVVVTTAERVAVAEQQLAAFAERWTVEVIRTSHIALQYSEVNALLLELSNELAELLTAQPFDPAPAGAIGTRLVVAHFTGSDALDRTLRVIGKEFLEAVDLPYDKTCYGLLTELTSALAGGYVEALRDRLFADQEMIKQAVFRARDIAERGRRASEARFRAVFNSSAVGIAIIDFSGQLQLINPVMGEILGYPPEELLRHNISELLAVEDAPKVLTAFEAITSGERTRYVGNVNFTGEDDEPRWTRLSLSLVREETGVPDYAVAVVEDISDLHLLRANQLTHALVDKLTGLPNHTQFMSVLDNTLAKAMPGERAALCYVDLDGFKIVNDGIGRATGDEVLKRVGNTLTAVFADQEAVVARIGGDGFAVLVTGTKRSLEVSQLITDALTELAEPVYYDAIGIAVSASVGIVEREIQGIGSEELLRAAELTVHRAKAAGKAQWVLFDREAHDSEWASFQLGAAIPGALENGEFTVSYQPVARITDQRLAGLRAVMHWEHPRLGPLQQHEFLAMAEETGFIVAIGRWMLEEVFSKVSDWEERFGAATPTVAVGITGRLAREEDLVRIVKDTIAKTGVSPRRLRIGVPSSVAVDDHGDPLENLDALRDIDIQTLVEGFGTSNAGLVDLRTLAISGVAVAPSVIRAYADAAEENSPFEQILSQIVRLSNQRQLRVIADGVETIDVANRLAGLGVELAAGPAFGAAVGPDQVEKRFHANNS
ncbi:MAG TPA: EAL domain-containing protein [Pseudonocardiaceae bacterium]|jgi:diguanylate cyclase (GGDEF)-like protein/PAS domain S-box-containing protein|nr:EAL domain-containing protein [Pseudonocardiaceae bacterium]